MPTDQKKKCFVIGPIGDPGSADRVNADWLLKGIIHPALANSTPGYLITRADKIASPGMITPQVINAVLDADLVIADLTSHNPNAFYELALAHMAGKKVVQLITQGQKIPFDLQDYRTLHYSRVAVEDIEKAVADLKEHVQAVEADEGPPSNPVTMARGTKPVKVSEAADTTAKIVQDLMMENRALAKDVEELSSRLLGVEYRTAGLPIPAGFVTTGPNAPGVGGFISNYPLGTVMVPLAGLPGGNRVVAGSTIITGGLLGIRDDERAQPDAAGAQQLEGEPDKAEE